MSSTRHPETVPGDGVAALARRPTAAALFVATRPRQWTKNLLVLAAPITAGLLTKPTPALKALAAVLVFVAASASTYLVNDLIDATADRLHPVKRYRPIAAGEIAPPLAVIAAAILLAIALVGALLIDVQLFVIVVVYLLFSYTYNFGLKRAAVVEMGVVSAGFVLRASAGGAADHVSISPWFLIVSSACAFLIVAGKRSAEQIALGEHSAEHRVSLGAYPPTFLLVSRVLATSVAVTAYCLWVFERAGHIVVGSHIHSMVWFEFSIVPFVLAILVLELAIETGRGGEPEELLLHDHTLQVLGLSWALLLALGIYL